MTLSLPSAKIMLLVSIMSCSGCVCHTHYDPTTTTAPTKDQLQIPKRGDKRGDWALAVSGGGIRSGLFSLGVMKSLYDQGVLREIDVISSNSGGSYTSYLMYNRFVHAKKASSGSEFGESVFKGENWTNTITGLQRQGNFVSVGSMLKVLLLPPKSKHSMYEDRIVRYGDSSPLTPCYPPLKEARKLRLEHLRPHILKDEAPNLIVESKVWLKDHGRKPFDLDFRASGILEMNPWYIGNQTLGYHLWKDEDSLPFSQAVAISGAAVESTQAQKIANPFNPQGSKLTVADGGKVENLAAYPLLLRGFDNVIIVDGGQDPCYKFEDYHYLRQMLDKKHIHLCISELDLIEKNGSKNPARWLTEHSVNKGTVTYPNGRICTVYYVKMGRPKTVFHRTVDAKGTSVLEVKWVHKGDVATKAALAHAVEDYANWLDRFNVFQLYKTPGKFVPFLRYYFPHMTTIDQSFYVDQVKALVGLGYFQADSYNFKSGQPVESGQ